MIRTVRLRSLLWGFAAVLTLISALMGAWILNRSWDSQVELMKSELQSTAATLANSVDRELISSQRRLLAITAQLPVDPLSAAKELEARAKYLVSISPDLRRIALNDERGSQLWNTGLVGAPLAQTQAFPHEQQALKSARPLVTDIYRGRSSGEWIVSHVIPLSIGGQGFLLVGSINPGDLAEIMRPAVRDHGAVGGILDRQKRFIARTLDGDRFLGQAPSRGWADAMRRSGSGVTRLVTLEGVASYSAWAPVPSSGWVVGVAVPGAPWDEAILASLGVHFGVVLVISLLGLAGAVLLGRWIAVEAEQVRAHAEKISHFRDAPAGRFHVEEFSQIQASLQAAGALLQTQQIEQQDLLGKQAQLLASEQAARSTADEANRLKNDFLAVLAHEMRSPLAAISNVGHVLAKQAGERNRMHDILQRQSDTLTRLVDDLLEVGQLMRDDVQLQSETVDLAEVAQGVLDALEVSGKLRSHEVQQDLRPAIVHGDRIRLAQVISNLLNNALRYTPAGGRIAVSVRSRADTVELRIVDTGRGIDAADLSRIFDLFVRTDDARRVTDAGLGIGLGIVRRLVQLHGGTVIAESEGAGRGATFVVSLPVAPSAPTPRKLEGGAITSIE